METPCLCPSEGHKYGGRVLTKTDVIARRLINFYMSTYSPTGTVQIAKFQQISHFFNLRCSILGRPFNEENRGRNRHNVERFLCAYYISAGQTSLLQVQ